LIIINKNELKEDLKYILAWLNSKIINDWYRIKGSHTGHRIRYTQSYVSQIPLKLIDWKNKKDVEVYNKILYEVNNIFKNKFDNKGRSQSEEKIDDLFSLLIY